MSSDGVEGMVLGVAYGDALGAPCEFSRKKCDGTFHPSWFASRRNQYNFEVTHEPGQVTDDTEMTIAAMHALVAGYSKTTAVKEYHEFVNSGTYSLGSNTKALLHGYKTVGLFDKRYSARFSSQKMIDEAQSNGHLMRAAPFALIDDPSLRDAILKLDTLLTNPSPTSGWAAALYVSMLRAALDASDPADARGRIKALLDAAVTPPRSLSDATTQCVVDGLDPLCNNRDVSSPRGWTLHSLALAIWAGMHSSSAHAGILDVINKGGDTDTNAAIAGGLLGAMFGRKAFESDPVAATNVGVIMGCLPKITAGKRDAAKTAVDRPSKYHPRELFVLASRITSDQSRHDITVILHDSNAVLATLAAASSKRPREREAVVVAIVGASRSGKTTLARRLLALFKGRDTTIEIVSQDSFLARGNIPLVNGKVSWEGPQRTDWDALKAKVVEASTRVDIVVVEGYLLFWGPADLRALYRLCLVCDSGIEQCRLRRSSFPSIDKFGARGWASIDDYVTHCIWPCHMAHETEVPSEAVHLPSEDNIASRGAVAYELLEALIEIS